MTKKVHVYASMLFVSALTLPLIEISLLGKDLNSIMLITCCTLAAPLPDIDLARQQKKKNIFALFFKHRGFTHTLIIPSILFILGYLFESQSVVSLFWGLGIGWLLHIIEDMFNSKGCPILYPLFKNRISIMKLHINNPIHNICFVVGWTFICFLLIVYRLFI